MPAADPATWWGTRDLSHADRPVRPADEPVRALRQRAGRLLDVPGASGSWSARPAAARKSSQAQGFGNLVHAIADRVAKDELGPGPVAVDELMELVDEVWDQLDFRTPVVARRASARRCARR